MTLLRYCKSVDTESRALPGSPGYHLLSVAVVGSEGVELHMPIRPLGLALDDIRAINNPPYPPEVLLQANPPSLVRNIVKELLRGHTVLVWNEEHEAQQLAFLHERDQQGRRLFHVQDVMRRAAPYVKQWNSHFGDYEYPSLKLAARTMGIEFEEPGWHDARADAQMIFDLWRYMEDTPPFKTTVEIMPLERMPRRPVAIEHDLPF